MPESDSNTPGQKNDGGKTVVLERHREGHKIQTIKTGHHLGFLFVVEAKTATAVPPETQA